jgi:limonene-1,2-epoxide hydrolase
MTEAERIVASFIDAWNARDLDAILAHFAPEAVYHNIPMEPLVGVEAIRGGLETFVGMARTIDWQVHASAATDDGRVLNERLDRFEVGEQWIEIAVMGIFEVEDGRIVAWRDYFDLAQFQTQMAAVSGA